MLEHLLARVMFGGLIVEPAVTGRTIGREPPPPPYAKASTLGKLPEVIPGLGTLYVSPSDVRYGPFLAYDRQGRLLSTVYRIALRDFERLVALPDLPAPGGRVTHVSFCFHEAHSGAEERHYHIILWHPIKARRPR